ncbi:MAG: SulP family inorganic anion transporter [Clostridium sp.]|nr:SulP family inorganic anion transporter [Acetatifactor muris]MCM1527677.1 SulP family inorganic anion transporter [Bacteroides sp.]MCM1563379.1 SulP family inorganic anion transporter [Clostridium sp.]
MIFKTLKGYRKEYIGRDLLSGIVIAAVSIPISMGYAEVAGIPAIYGLYGSVIPIFLFALFSSSPQFIFGVDAAPAAIVGTALASMGIAQGSPEAMIYVPMMALFAGLWLLLFYVLKAGKMVDYISTPVMGGFISGITVTIILMQIPKILGSGSGSGELPELIRHIARAAGQIHPLSVALGTASLLIILISGKFIPKFPMAIVVMALGVFLTRVCHVDDYGVRLLAQVEPGLPDIVLPRFAGVDLSQVAGRSLMVAIVIMAETLLAENNFAFQNGYRIEDNREVLAFAVGNIAAALVGCCPVNGSISRTSMNQQYGGRTQAVSVVASATMVLLLLFGTGFIGYLPVPVLTAIIISALLKVVEWHLAKRLFQVSRKEFYIFMAAFFGVLIFGSIYGVIIGLVLSFVAVILQETNPPRTFLGMIPEKDGFYDLSKNRYAREIQGVRIYQFSESLFFANIKIFQKDIENCIGEDTRAVIVDMSTVTNLDITAADRLEILARNLKARNIAFYLTEHKDIVNEQMRRLGIGHLIEEGHVRRTVTAALHDMGLSEPYPLIRAEEGTGRRPRSLSAETENTLEEFAWAFGGETVDRIEEQVHSILSRIREVPELEQLIANGLEGNADAWKSLGAIDEDELVRRLELHMDEFPEKMRTRKNMRLVWKLLEDRRNQIRERLMRENPEELERLEAYREKLERRLEKQNPEAARRLHEWEAEVSGETHKS